MSFLPNLLLSLITGGLLPWASGCHPHRASDPPSAGAQSVFNGVVAVLPIRAGAGSNPIFPAPARGTAVEGTASVPPAVQITDPAGAPPRNSAPAEPRPVPALPPSSGVELVSLSPVAGEVHVIPFTRRLARGGSPGSDHIVVPVRLNDGRAHAFLLDTGAQATTVVVPKELVQLPSVRLKVRDRPSVLVQGVGGQRLPAWRLTSDTLSVGNARRDRMDYLLLPLPSRGPGLGDSTYGPIMGVLGNDFLSKFLLTIDYDRSVVILTER